MTRQGEVLAELGLAPVWVRRELLPQCVEAPESAPTPATMVTAAVPVQSQPQAQHQNQPAPAATAAVSADAPTSSKHPLTSTAQAARASLQVGKPSAAPSKATPQPQAAVIISPNAQARADEIANMSWNELQNAISQCTACALCQSRQQAVFGVGDPQASLVVIGEAPGAEEDRRGEPFVGTAGKLLDNMLAAIGKKRGDQVYIANVLKCRPPGNRDPKPDEVASCAPFLKRQLQLINPQILLASGRFAAQTLLDTDAPLSVLRGHLQHYGPIPVVVTYHPAYLLRNLPDKRRAWEDLLFLQEIMDNKTG